MNQAVRVVAALLVLWAAYVFVELARSVGAWPF